jgi:hypothetical protein
MTCSPHRDVDEEFGTLTSVSTSLQYRDGRVCGLVETCVDGRLSLLDHALGTKAQFKQVRFRDLYLIILGSASLSLMTPFSSHSLPEISICHYASRHVNAISLYLKTILISPPTLYFHHWNPHQVSFLFFFILEKNCCIILDLFQWINIQIFRLVL